MKIDDASFKTLPGPHPSKVDSLTFVLRYPDDFTTDDVPSCSDLRLFSSGGGSELLEWDMDRACVRVCPILHHLHHLVCLISNRELSILKVAQFGAWQ